jgi:hypothetical protein
MIRDYLSDCHRAVLAHPDFNIRLCIFYSALAVYHSPSDISGISGLRRELIRATPSWRNNQSRYDCVFVYSQSSTSRRQLEVDVARVMAFFSFIHDGKLFPCALVHEFPYSSRQPDKDTGLWIVVPKFVDDTQPCLRIISLDRIFRAAHLIPVYKTRSFISRSLTMEKTLDEFKRFYINKFIDYHAFRIVVRAVSISFSWRYFSIILMPVAYLGVEFVANSRLDSTAA